MAQTVLEKHVHVFDLENEMPIHPYKAPKEIYKETLIVRGSFLAAGVVLSIIFRFFPNIWEPVTYLPTILMVVAIVGTLESLFKAREKWRKNVLDDVRYSLASREILEKLMELNPLYKGRRDDSVMFYPSGNGGMNDFFVYHAWSNYIAQQNPTKKETVKGVELFPAGGSLYITDSEGWSFSPEFVTPSQYKVTVQRIQWEVEK